MDRRTELKPGARLPFPGMECTIVGPVGRGSNAIVYEGEYRDSVNERFVHRVLIKELFPYEPGGHIWRDGQQRICRDGQGDEVWELHRRSFERGNRIHLRMLAQHPDQIGGNLNTHALNQTLYTLLDYSGGHSLEKELKSGAPQTLPQLLARMRKLLMALSVLHDQGFLHLDVSLDNVLLIGQGELERVMLIDYNSMHRMEELSEQGGIYFSAKEGFTAPEVRMGMVQRIGPHTDLFSAACVLYALLTGTTLTTVQLSRKAPPDVSDTPLLRNAPATVKAQAAAILRRGLCVLPDKRYRSCSAMLQDLEELERRIAGVGVTHAALWEAGRGSVQHLVRQNPSLRYVERESGLYPLRIQKEDGTSMPAQAWMDELIGENGASSLLVGEGGMGKSTVLLRSALHGTSRYTPAAPAVMYIPLMGIRPGEGSFILDHILQMLRFDSKTQTMEDARHALLSLLNPAQKRTHEPQTRLLLLLDGLNEAAGDPSALLEEIRRLSGCSALRMLIATRSVPEALTLPKAAMVPLEEDDVAEALRAHGLLQPESADMRGLLRTPMMLSLFIQTADSAGGQVQCQTRTELIDGYLNALCQKASADAENAVDYRVEAAVRLVLPAIAREIGRRGRPLDNPALYPVIRRCHRILCGRALARAFPEWIGHSREALGEGAQSAEAWFGEIVQRTLWWQLGLLVRDEDGGYRILHQILQEHLMALAEANERRIRAQRTRAGLLAAATALVLACMGLLAYELWLKPQPYDRGMSAAVIDALTVQYINCGLQYEAMTGMLGGQTTPETCALQIAQLSAPVSQTTRLALRSLTESDADVIPWSGQPLDFDSAEKLLALPGERQPEYARYILAYQLVCRGDTRTTEDEFSSALLQLLEADADIAWLLERSAAAPHIAGMSESQRLTYDTGMLSLPAAQESRAVDTSRGLAYALTKAYETRRRAQDGLNRLSVMYAPEVQELGGDSLD